MLGIIEIIHDNKLYAIVFKNNVKAKGTRFLTPYDYTLQLGLIEHPTGKKLRKHLHNPKIKYEVDTTQEFLYVEHGKLKVMIYQDQWDLIDEVLLSAGDFYLHVAGGHGFEIIEKCRVIEIKQGPYPGDKKAKMFDPKDNE